MNQQTTEQQHAVWDVITAVQGHLRANGLAADVRRGEGIEAIQAASSLMRALGVEPVLDATAHAVISATEPWTDRDDRAAQ